MINRIPQSKAVQVNPVNLVHKSEFQLMKLVNAN